MPGDEEVRWWYRDKRKACESGRLVRDNLLKVPAVGCLGDAEAVVPCRNACALI